MRDESVVMPMSALLYRFPLLAAVLALLAVVLFLPGLGGAFIFDDTPNIVTNTPLHMSELSLSNLLYAAYSFLPGDRGRALPMMTFALDYWRGGLDPAVFKTTNLMIHGLTVLALGLFFRTLLRLAQWPPRRAAAGALLLALIWAIHPLQVSTVLYVVQRMQMLGTLFLVLALLAYLHARQAQLEDRRSRLYWVLAGLCWVLALASKEDSALLPAYTLALELTVLRFQAAQASLARRWQQAYGALTLVGALAFFLVVVPHYWHWQDYPGRNFSSVERLLTQGRVLLMYLGQILLPLPSTMSFYYDSLVVSRGPFAPLSTLPAWAVLLALLAVAWRLRSRRPLFALGVFLFFAGHFISSNVVNLELAFEHRNHFPLIGVVLAVGDLCVAVWQRWALRPQLAAILLVAALLVMGGATVSRAYSWGEPLRFLETGVKVAPHSERAWLELCTFYFNLSNQQADSPYLEQAINICQEGAGQTTSSALLSNVVIFKSLQGSATQDDWSRFLSRLQQEPMTTQSRDIVWVTLDNVARKVPLDEKGVLQTIDVIAARARFTPYEYLRLASYIFTQTSEPERALPYLQQAVELSPPDDPTIQKVLGELAGAGRQEWVDRLTQIQRAKTQAGGV